MDAMQNVVLEEIDMINMIEGADDDLIDLALGADPNDFSDVDYIDIENEEALNECKLYTKEAQSVF